MGRACADCRRTRQATCGGSLMAADPASAAKALAVDQLFQDETLRLLQGIGWSFFSLLPNFYVGSMYGVPRLGIPSINMQDAAQGFRTIDPVNVGEESHAVAVFIECCRDVGRESHREVWYGSRI